MAGITTRIKRAAFIERYYVGASPSTTWYRNCDHCLHGDTVRLYGNGRFGANRHYSTHIVDSKASSLRILEIDRGDRELQGPTIPKTYSNSIIPAF